MSDTGNYSNPVLASFHGIVDLFRHKEPIGQLQDTDRLDGKTALVTGANSGLGLATAIALACRGARVIMACRSGIPEAAETVKQASGNDKVEMIRLDLADFAAIHACCDELKARGERIDRLVLNAGVVPQKPQKTSQGYEMMFGVHALGNHLFVQRLLADGTVPNRRYANNAVANEHPRIVFVSSETHRSGTPITLEKLGEFVAYSPMSSIAQYGHSKLVLTSLAMELARRLQDEDGVDVSVHALCPGPVNSNIAREAPKLVKPLLKLVMGALFSSPEKASLPVQYLSCSPQIEGQSSLYLHLMVKKDIAAQAQDETLAEALWTRVDELIASTSPALPQT